jgi:hypothetical protein
MCMGGIALWVTYLFGARVYSRRAGIIAALLLAAMPRVFYHAHLAAFDMGMVAMWTLSVYAYWRATSLGGIGRILLAGIMFGLTLETKHNAWLLPGVVLPHALLLLASRLATKPRRGIAAVPATLLSMAVVGPVVFWGLWPYIWHDTLARLKWYFNFHVDHVYYNMEFLGVNYFDAPSPLGYMPAMILATVPSTTLLLFAVGAGDQLRRGVEDVRARLRGRAAQADTSEAESTRSPAQAPNATAPGSGQADAPLLCTNALFGLACAAALAPWLLPQTPIFGGTKHWMPAYPFLMLFAGHGFDLVLGALASAAPRLRGASLHTAQLGIAGAVLAAPAAITIHAHPFGLTSYVPFVGGTRGGADLGLNRQFWGYTTQSANAQYFEKQAPAGVRVFIHDTAWDSWARMIDEGRVRKDIRGVGAPSQADFAIVHHELHMNEVEYQIWVAYQTRCPTYVVAHDEVPVVSIYKRP